MGESSTIAPSQLVHESKKQKETLITEFSDAMSNSAQKMKDVLRVDEQTQQFI